MAVQVRPLVPNIKPTFQLVFLCLNFNKSPRKRVGRVSVQSKPAHWYHLLLLEVDTKTDLCVGFFVPEVQQIATQACRPSVAPSHGDQSLINKAPPIDLDESYTCETSWYATQFMACDLNSTVIR